MNSLITYGGLPLLIDGTSLTTDPDCCCYYPPPPDQCPPCCVRIDWGEFNEDGDLESEYVVGDYDITVIVTMPTKDSRIVCNTQEINVTWSILPDDPSPSGGYAQFGPAWESTAESPAPEKVFERGLVDWIGIESAVFGLTMRLSSCFLDSPQFLAGITIGTDVPEWELEIPITRCPSAARCCPVEYDCEPCCYELASVASSVLFDNKIWFFAESPGGYRVYYRVVTSSLGIWCPGEPLTVEFDIIPPRWDENEEYNAVIQWDGTWFYSGSSPGIAVDGEIITNQPLQPGGGKVDWGTQSATEYEASITADCGELLCSDLEVATIQIRVLGLPGGDFSTDIGGFEPCDEDFDGCCCPLDCTCGCQWPLSEDFCDTAEDDGLFGLYEIDGPTKVEDLEILITASDNVFCSSSTNEVAISQAAPSWHLGLCDMVDGKMCPKDNGLLVPAFDGSQTCGAAPGSPSGRVRIELDPEDCDAKINVTIDFSMEGGIPFSAERIPIQTGGLIDCNRIEASGSKVLEGVTYNWTITGNIIGGKACPCDEDAT